MKYLFLCGCPRSGTTALWHLFASEPQIAMGLERFKNRARQKAFELTPQLFEYNRFFTLEKGDTHFVSLTKGTAGKYYEQLKERFYNCELYGDKLPNLYRNFDNLFLNFESPKVVIIFRNIFDVANSYEQRKNDPEDKWSRGVEEAVIEWNMAITQTLKHLERNVHCLVYEDFYYNESLETIQKLEDYLDFKFSTEFLDTYAKLKKKALKKDKERYIYLSSAQKYHIIEYANFEGYRQLLQNVK